MSNIVDFSSAAKNIKQQRAAKNKKHILCLEGHHSWQASKSKPFENKQGKLVTVFICKYCNKERTKLI